MNRRHNEYVTHSIREPANDRSRIIRFRQHEIKSPFTCGPMSGLKPDYKERLTFYCTYLLRVKEIMNEQG